MTENYAYHTGRTVGKYELESLIGRGGMAEVYKSHHPDLGRALAIKILHPFYTDDPDFIERFRREARAAAALRHPHIVQIYDFDVTEDGLYYMVMEFIEGLSLEQYLHDKARPLPLAEATHLFKQVADAVDLAHENGTIHRDIKPANIMIDTRGQAYLADFGIAQMVGSSRITKSGATTGTPAYMAPEQVRGQEVTTAADIYALGVLLYEMVTGAQPYSGESAAAIMIQQATELPTPPREAKPDLDLRVEQIILQAMEKTPESRFPTAGQMTAALEAIANAAPSPAPPQTDDQTRLYESQPNLAQPLPDPDPGATGAATTAPTEQRTAAAVTQIKLATPGGTPVWIWPVIGIAAVALIAVGFLLARQPGAATTTETAVSAASYPGPTDEAAGATAVVAPTPSPRPTLPPEIPGMIFIPGDIFGQGNDAGNSDEAPVHQVSLDGYYMDLTEVTNEAYAAFIADTERPAPTGWLPPEPSLWEVTAGEVYALGDNINRFDYNGDLVRPGQGSLIMNLDADNDTGTLEATYQGALEVLMPVEDAGTEEFILTSLTGDFRIVQTNFSGSNSPIKEDGIGDFVVMHGSSGHETPRYPQLLAYIGTWGTADLYLDDELLLRNLGIHVMFSDGIRDDEGHFIPRLDGSCCFSPDRPDDNLQNPDSREISVWLFGGGGSDYGGGEELWINLYYNQVEVLEAPENAGPPTYPDGQAQYPAAGVSWADAEAFCTWRDARLPTEAEWEYAARGPEGFLYPWGSESGDASLANGRDSFQGPTAVGAFPNGASFFGLLDMAGNVWEWVADWYAADYYAAAPAENPAGPESGEARVVRGGSYAINDIVGLDELRATHRRPVDPLAMAADIGFRCARSLVP